MADDIAFDTAFPVAPETTARLSPLVRRVVADNPGPFTFRGTCTYIVGEGSVAIIDPGPDLPGHSTPSLRRCAGKASATSSSPTPIATTPRPRRR